MIDFIKDNRAERIARKLDEKGMSKIGATYVCSHLHGYINVITGEMMPTSDSLYGCECGAIL